VVVGEAAQMASDIAVSGLEARYLHSLYQILWTCSNRLEILAKRNCSGVRALLTPSTFQGHMIVVAGWLKLSDLDIPSLGFISTQY
jgi:hypothetical protein